MKIFILLGHPDSTMEPLSRRLADAYDAAARKAGHEVRRMNLGEMQFNANLRRGYRERMELEPDLLKVQENLTWCEHFVLVYPNWWGGMPAQLKGMWDRMFLPHFAFSMYKNGWGWHRLLKGRTARVIILCSNRPLYDSVLFGNFSASIGWSILRFGGLHTHITSFGPSEKASEKLRLKWVSVVEKLARKGK
ncbi:MAG TPA: NAD(P)H-dependent oxidoreductase [Candidatus Paceibacterota bacterium]|nr:NAD(P)H-dependent oxidoreductase [Candidatus Paceibacterota bacterium]